MTVASERRAETSVTEDAKTECEEVRPLNEREVRFTWRDGHAATYSYAYIRRNCRCASCVNEWTHEPILDPETVPEDLTVRSIEPVGHYALKFEFRDGHDTGIYAWNFIRSVCPCPSCVQAKATG